jgi:dimethylaniline monooxygenase (N-oxide forming)
VASLTRRIHLPSREKMQKEIKKAEKEQEKNVSLEVCHNNM